MPWQIKKIQTAHEEQWQNFARARGTLYHDIAWAKVIAQTYSLQPEYYLVENDDQTVGLLPFMRLNAGKVLSLPYLPFAGALFASEVARQKTMELWHKQLAEKRYRIMESRSAGIITESFSGYVNMVAPISSNLNTTWQSLRTKERNQVRHAESLGLQVSFGRQYINDFYRLYCRRMHDFGTPPHAVHWFTNILAAIPGANILVVALKHSIVGAMFFIKHKDTIHISYAATDTQFNHLCPNVLMYWEMLKYASAEHCVSVDLGRTTFASPNFQFKKHWGGRPYELLYESFSLKDNSTRRLMPLQADKNKKNMSRIWCRLPYAFHRYLGPKIRKYLP